MTKWTSLLAAFFLIASCATNPVTGKPELSLVSDTKANAMGHQAYPQVRQQWGGDYNDPELQAYVTEVGMSLAAVSHTPSLPYAFTVTNSSKLNAVALPGGKIFITRGLLAELEDESQLAAVLGHEIGHATAKHGQSAMSWGIFIQATAVVASILIDTNSDSQNDVLVGYLALQAGLFGAQMATMKYGREKELQADGLGVDYMIKAGYKPEGAIGVQKLLASKQKGKPGAFEALMRSHPVSEVRVKRVEMYVMENSAGSSFNLKGDGIHRARFLEKTKSLRKRTRAYKHYEQAIAYMKSGRTKDALSENRKAIKMAPREAEFYIQKGDFALKAKRYNEAEQAYNKAKQLNPKHYKVHSKLGHLARIRKQNDKAIKHHKKATDLNASYSQSYIESGYAYMDKKDYKKAALMFDAGTKSDPSNGEAYTALGMNYERLGLHQQAYDAYKQGYKKSRSKRSKNYAGQRLQYYQNQYRP